MPKEVVISTSRLNSYGYRVLTSGIDISQYEKNPILLWGHHRTWRGTTDEVLPIGRVENLRVEGDSLIGTPVFDEKDEFAKKIKAKFEGGFLKMVSAGLDVVERSEDPMYLLQGQTRASVTKSKLIEVSIVDIGANDDALALSYSGKAINHEKEEDLVFLNLTTNNNNENINSEQNMKQLMLALGLSENATEQEAIAALSKIQQENKTLKEDREKAELKRIEDAVDSAVRLGKITALDKDKFIELGKSAGCDTLNFSLEKIPAGKRPSEVINHSSGSTSTTDKKFSELTDAEKIELRDNDKEAYKKLFKAEYGIEASI